MQHAAFGVYLVEFDPAGLRHAQAMPEHEKQRATVVNLCEPLDRLSRQLDSAFEKIGYNVDWP